MSVLWRVFVVVLVVLVWGVGGINTNEAASGVEICDNGIDDDNDGLVDINDQDCTCHANGDTLLFASSLIPNSSFEERYCCPTNIAQLSCAKDWIQASDATTDYFHTCGYMGDVFRAIPPKPYPAGDGFVAFRDEDDYKEYTGACLNSPLLDGVEYRLQFYVGFGKPGQVWGSASPFHLSIFGAKYCSDLPFGIPGSLYSDCPMGLPNWIQIADTYVTGNDEWVKVTLDFTVNQDIEVIAVGPSCDRVLKESYYFLDGLQLAEKRSFDVKKLEVKSDLCNTSVVLTAPSFSNVTYQWYRDGVAIAGATSNTYTISSSPESNYRVRLMINGECLLTEAYHYKYLNNIQTRDTLVCENDVVEWENQMIDAAGKYTATYQNQYGCDSILVLNVMHQAIQEIFRDTTLCQGEVLEMNGRELSEVGTHQIALVNRYGCDSIVHVNLDYYPDYHTLIDTAICAGEVLFVGGEELTRSGSYSYSLTSATGCDSIVDVQLNVVPLARFTIDTAVCAADSVFFDRRWITTPGNYEFHLTSSSGCDSVVYLNLIKYKDYSIQQDTAICYGDVLTYDGRQMSAPGTYTFAYNSVEGCDSILYLNLVVMSEIVTAMSEISPITCNGERDAVIRALPSGGDGRFTYVWSSGETTDEVQGKGKGMYSVTITDGMGCTEISSINVVEPEPLDAVLQPLRPTCLDPEGGSLQLREISGGTEPYQIWLNGQRLEQGPLNARQFGPGSYDVRLEDAHGCQWNQSIEFSEPGGGTLDLITDENNLKRGQTVQLQVAMSDVVLPIKKIKWSPASVVSCQDCSETSFVMDRANMTIEVEVTDDEDCIYTRSVPFKATGKFFIPNVFSPNGDGVNDAFQVLTDDEDAVIASLKIYDRWGNVVFGVEDRSVLDPSAAWQGTFQGKPLSPAAFVYILEMRDQLGQIQRIQGSVTLIR